MSEPDHDTTTPATASLPGELPIFPLQTVLFPGGTLPLRVFEARYMDMSTRCLREDSVFGVNLIAEGHEVGTPARPHPVGVSARITAWDMAQPGVLHIVVRGERRFRILATETGENGLLLGRVEWLAEPEDVPLPYAFSSLATLLEAIIEDAGDAHFPPPHFMSSANWVGMRLAEVLPISLEARHALLLEDAPLARLTVLQDYLASQGLVPR